ncbi:hypothetical protein K523DRAFT_417970 [Schizophyllum commune Tattone D]|nr:hypothetical protein K523DRAFT_417970 [Schizophyllum commune Tattone D]
MAIDSKTRRYEESKKEPRRTWECYRCGPPSEAAYYYYDREQGIVTTDNIEDPLTCDEIRKFATAARHCSRKMVPRREDAIWDVVIRKGRPTAICSWVKGLQFKFSAKMDSVTKDSQENYLRTLSEFPCHKTLP